MYKLVVVEDEKDARERLISLIEKSQNKFELMATYENGMDAYDGIISDNPDLVMTDIRIPYIDGIELSKKLREMLPLVKIIIITGYHEFSYAKEAANLGVLGFVSKPITQEDVDALLQKAKTALDAEFMTTSSLTQLEAFYENSLPIIREYDLYRLSTMSSMTPAFLRKLRHDNILLNFSFFAMCVFDFDNVEDFERYELGFSLTRNLVGEILGEVYSVEMFTRSEKLCLILKSNTKIIFPKIERLLETILIRVGRFTDLSLSVGISNAYTESHDFAGMYREALRALEYRGVMGGRKVCFFQNAVPIPAGKILFDSADIKQLEYLLRYQSTEECLEHLSMIRQKLDAKEAKNSYYFVITSILNILISACDDLEGLYAQCDGQVNIYRRLFDSKTADQAFGFLADLVGIIRKLNDGVIVDRMEVNLQKILTYMETHYRDAELSLETLARAVSFSVSYISALLKKNKNTSFIKHITTLRMEKAKQLLKNTPQKIVDIAESLGYADPFYFSHCFKKYTGISPKEYRSNE